MIGHPGLRALFFNSQVFGAGLMAAGPLLAVLLLLRELHFPAWQYGLALGLPCVGGVLGALALQPLTVQFGARRVLLASGIGRALAGVEDQRHAEHQSRSTAARLRVAEYCGNVTKI